MKAITCEIFELFIDDFSVNLLFTVEHCSQVGEIKNIHSIVQFQKDTP